jgi:hypothetical protein
MATWRVTRVWLVRADNATEAFAATDLAEPCESEAVEEER